jgi:23S rRNA (cytidine1920-2'-O)/16S rRNA (cytidine1409-2'-O)-methyltransferase
MRADLYLFRSGRAKSRAEAKKLIEGGFASIDGRKLTKPAEEIDESISHEIAITDSAEVRYASRGGLKLEAALDAFSVSPKGRVALDIGASGGGFTDCMLRRGACLVYALDCGSGQLADFLRRDERVCVYENYNARFLDPKDFPKAPSLVTMDVSFISQTLIFPAIHGILPQGGELVSLVKPQFEVGRSGVGKGGIVKSDSLRRSAVERVREAAIPLGWECLGVIDSPILGGDGNAEYLIHFRIPVH